MSDVPFLKKPERFGGKIGAVAGALMRSQVEVLKRLTNTQDSPQQPEESSERLAEEDEKSREGEKEIQEKRDFVDHERFFQRRVKKYERDFQRRIKKFTRFSRPGKNKYAYHLEGRDPAGLKTEYERLQEWIREQHAPLQGQEESSSDQSERQGFDYEETDQDALSHAYAQVLIQERQEGKELNPEQMVHILEDLAKNSYRSALAEEKFNLHSFKSVQQTLERCGLEKSYAFSDAGKDVEEKLHHDPQGIFKEHLHKISNRLARGAINDLLVGGGVSAAVAGLVTLSGGTILFPVAAGALAGSVGARTAARYFKREKILYNPEKHLGKQAMDQMMEDIYTAREQSKDFLENIGKRPAEQELTKEEAQAVLNQVVDGLKNTELDKVKDFQAKETIAGLSELLAGFLGGLAGGSIGSWIHVTRELAKAKVEGVHMVGDKLSSTDTVKKVGKLAQNIGHFVLEGPDHHWRYVLEGNDLAVAKLNLGPEYSRHLHAVADFFPGQREVTPKLFNLANYFGHSLLHGGLAGHSDPSGQIIEQAIKESGKYAAVLLTLDTVVNKFRPVNTLLKKNKTNDSKDQLDKLSTTSPPASTPPSTPPTPEVTSQPAKNPVQTISPVTPVLEITLPETTPSLAPIPSAVPPAETTPSPTPSHSETTPKPAENRVQEQTNEGGNDQPREEENRPDKELPESPLETQMRGFRDALNNQQEQEVCDWIDRVGKVGTINNWANIPGEKFIIYCQGSVETLGKEMAERRQKFGPETPFKVVFSTDPDNRDEVVAQFDSLKQENEGMILATKLARQDVSYDEYFKLAQEKFEWEKNKVHYIHLGKENGVANQNSIVSIAEPKPEQTEEMPTPEQLKQKMLDLVSFLDEKLAPIRLASSEKSNRAHQRLRDFIKGPKMSKQELELYYSYLRFPLNRFEQDKIIIEDLDLLLTSPNFVKENGEFFTGLAYLLMDAAHQENDPERESAANKLLADIFLMLEE